MEVVKLSLVFLVLALAMTDKVYSFNSESGRGLNHFYQAVSSGGPVGDYIGDDNEMLLDSEASRRALARGRSHIGYEALKANSVPCGRRGHSYYDCQKRQRANPYKRGCSAITHCARYTG
ncbi:Rapid ALkalinization Factor [Parasponia andersonii]|uniref:Rapid ALkalinization Factor n=1 Tax=Parasponia andersonii TaxID=3476 RepID=A0A2P5AQQ7_PARAD|nr:Rapid ALkalinization Factor [Parasponia andersonii]